MKRVPFGTTTVGQLLCMGWLKITAEAQPIEMPFPLYGMTKATSDGDGSHLSISDGRESLHSKYHSIPYIVHYFWLGPMGLRSKVLHYIGNRVPFWMQREKHSAWLMKGTARQDCEVWIKVLLSKTALPVRSANWNSPRPAAVKSNASQCSAAE